MKEDWNLKNAAGRELDFWDMQLYQTVYVYYVYLYNLTYLYIYICDYVTSNKHHFEVVLWVLP